MPKYETVGAKVFTLLLAVLVTLYILPAGTAPPKVQAKVIGLPPASVAFAVKASVEPTATLEPLAAGFCEEQTGGVFFVTVQVRLTVLVPFVEEATSVLAPTLRSDERTPTEVLVPPTVLPLSVQVVRQFEALGTTLKLVSVEATEDTVMVAVLGVLELTVQSFCTVKFHEQLVVS